MNENEFKKISLKLINLEKAYQKLNQFLLVPQPSQLEKTGIIKAFEYTFELFWKIFKVKAESEGLFAASPKMALSYAFQAGLITKEEIWLSMLEKRNLAAHTYNEAQANEVYLAIKNDFASEFKTVLEKLKLASPKA